MTEQNVGPDVSNKSNAKLEITHPKTPQLTTKSRSRPVMFPSHTELENRLAEDMAKYALLVFIISSSIIELVNIYS